MTRQNARYLRLALGAQRNEITEHRVYSELARRTRDSHNRGVLSRIAKDELAHYRIFRDITGRDAPPRCVRAWRFVWTARILGLTFGVKLMELGEGRAQVSYREIAKAFPKIRRVGADEERHEKALLDMLDEERLKYMGSVVLGLNDALVELTGALAGFTFALGKTALIAVVGLITGIAASFSMAASAYLSARSEEGEGKNPTKSAVYTGVAYIATVVVLILPYMVLSNRFHALGLTLSGAVLLILFFTFYISVARDLPFRARFLEMVGISLGVAAASFGIGFLVRQFLGVDV